jgi:hypothetical protein
MCQETFRERSSRGNEALAMPSCPEQIRASLPRLVRATGERLRLEANPQGWQRVAGGRSPFALNDHRKSASDGQAPRRGARGRVVMQVVTGETPGRKVPAQFSRTTPMSSGLGSDGSGTPCRGAGLLLRRCPEVAAPQNPRRRPATLWQPFGLTDAECPDSKLPALAQVFHTCGRARTPLRAAGRSQDVPGCSRRAAECAPYLISPLLSPHCLA